MTPQLKGRLREAALTIGALLGLACVVLAVASTFFGVHVLVFRSGSMSPTIETGGAALARTVVAADLRVGDIVSVQNAEGIRVTHRIAAIDHAGAKASLTLKGDANRAADEYSYQVVKAERVFWHANRLGYLVSALGSPYALFAGGAFAALLLYLGFSKGAGPGAGTTGGARGEGQTQDHLGVTSPMDSVANETRSAKSLVGRSASTRGVVTAVIAATLLLPPAMSSTMAGFTDSPTVAADFRVMIPCSHAGKPIHLSWVSTGAATYTIVSKTRSGNPVKTFTTTYTPKQKPAEGQIITFDLEPFGGAGWSGINYVASIYGSDGALLGTRDFFEYRSGGTDFQGCGAR